MDVRGFIGLENAPDSSGKAEAFGPSFSRSYSLTKVKVDTPNVKTHMLVNRREVFSGSFTFDPTDENGVIKCCNNFGRMISAITLEKVNNNHNADSKIAAGTEFFPVLHRLLRKRQNWGTEFIFNGKATFLPKLTEWTMEVLKDHKDVLDKAEIFGAVGVSCYPYHYVIDVWRAFCELWGPLSNTFHHGGGELGISLYDLKVIGGLPILGEYYEEFIPTNKVLTSPEKLVTNPHYQTVVELLRNHAKLCDSNHRSEIKWDVWIDHFFRGELCYVAFGEEDYEHILSQINHASLSKKEKLPLNVSPKTALAAYLALWLSRFVLPHGHNIVRPETFYMASLMAEGKKVSLAPTVLSYIYHGMGQVATSRNPGNAAPTFPVHYVIGWLAEYFPSLYPCRPDTEFPASYPRLARYAGLIGIKKKLYEARVIFRRDLYISFRPFSFPQEKSTDFCDDSNISDLQFEYLVNLRSNVLPVRVADKLWLEPYYPNRFSRQFGYDQGMPTNNLQFSVSQRSQRSLKDLAEACARLMQRNTGVLFHIPAMSFVGKCTYWYCRWWGKTTSSYLSQAVSKVNVILTKKSGIIRETSFVITNIRDFAPNLKGWVKLQDVDVKGGQSSKRRKRSKSSSPENKTSCSEQKPEVNENKTSCSEQEPEVDENKTNCSEQEPEVDRDIKRLRYNRSSDDDASDFRDSAVTPDINETDGVTSSLTLALTTPLVNLDGNKELGDLGDSMNTPLNDVADDSPPTDLSAVSFKMNDLVVVSGFGETIDVAMTTNVQSLIGTISELLSVSSAPEVILRNQPAVEYMLKQIEHAICGMDESQRNGFDWFIDETKQLLRISAVVSSDDSILEKDRSIDIGKVQELSHSLENCLTARKLLLSEAAELKSKAEDFQLREKEIQDMMAKLEEEKRSCFERSSEITNQLQDSDALEQRLKQSMIEAGSEKVKLFTSHKEDLKLRLACIGLLKRK